MLSLPQKTTYLPGEAIDLTGLKLTACDDGGAEKTTSEGYTCIDTEVPNMATKQVIIVEWDGKSTTFDVEVLEFYSYEIAVESINSDTDTDVGRNSSEKRYTGFFISLHAIREIGRSLAHRMILRWLVAVVVPSNGVGRWPKRSWRTVGV